MSPLPPFPWRGSRSKDSNASAAPSRSGRTRSARPATDAGAEPAAAPRRAEPASRWGQPDAPQTVDVQRPTTSAEARAVAAATAPAARSEVQLVSGRLSDVELAAIAVAVSAMSAASRREAEERALAERFGSAADGWADPVHRLPRTHAMRAQASETSWMFSGR